MPNYNSRNTVISANTLFHFTNSMDNLLSILSYEFQPHYCLESFGSLGALSEFAIPMVCFCDIPFFSIRKHLETYGYYGIGMSKEWGKKNGTSPVLYTYPKSKIDSHLSSIIEAVTKQTPAQLIGAMLGNDNTTKDYLFKLNSDLRKLSSYIKPYEGVMWRNSENTYKVNIRFYDEREWRFVPDVLERDLPTMLMREEYLNETKRKDCNAKIASLKMSFNPNDIKYLIIRSEDEVEDMIPEIQRIKRWFPTNMVNKLLTRIITVDQIDEDF